MITLAMLVWDTAQVSLESAVALVQEAQRLRSAGYPTKVLVFDNGSSDGFSSALMEMELDIDLMHTPHNVGISAGRNALIDGAVKMHGADYILLTDGDIEILPGSVVEMVKFLDANPVWAGLSPSPLWSTWHRDEITSEVPPITERMLSRDALMYVCGYGLFRAAPFNGSGEWGRIRFETDGPFGLPGWGHEDDDFYCQLLTHHLKVAYVEGLTYLHRHPKSSWRALELAGVNIEQAFYERKMYLLKKWRTHPLVSGILNLMRAQQLTVERPHG